MELEKFITASLNSIIKGINESKDFAIEHGARINPHVGKWDFDKKMTTYYGNEEGARGISEIEFDIAITTSAEKGKEGGLGITVLSGNLGGKLSKRIKDETISRLKFNVPVVLPNTDLNQK